MLALPRVHNVEAIPRIDLLHLIKWRIDYTRKSEMRAYLDYLFIIWREESSDLHGVLGRVV